MIRQAGLSGLPVCGHTSLSSFGAIEGGAASLVDAYLEEDCTLVVPSFVYDYFLPAPPGRVIAQNGGAFGEPHERVYHRSGNDISGSMGAVPREILSRPERVRGRHAHNSFAAVGPLAEAIISSQTALDVYAPLAEMARRGGHIVLMGVGLARCTALHWAEQLAGRNLFRCWGYDEDGSIEEAAVGSCSEGFVNLADAVAPYERRVTAGSSLWRILPLREAMEAAARAIRDNPEITRCAQPGCRRCADMAAGGPVL